MNREEFQKLVSQYVDLKTNKLLKEPEGEYYNYGYITLENQLLFVGGKGKHHYLVYSTQDRMFVWDSKPRKGKMVWCLEGKNNIYPSCQFVERNYPLSRMNGGTGWGDAGGYVVVNFKSQGNFINWLNENPFEVKQ